jgi:site-specific recombinase XerD
VSSDRLAQRDSRSSNIDPARSGGRGIDIHSLRNTAINDAIRNGANLHEVRKFAGHSGVRTTELYFVRKEEDTEVTARRIQIRITGRTGR